MKFKTIFCLLLATSPLFADLKITTSIEDVAHRGTSELVGTVKVTINDSDFSEANSETPIFFRVCFDHNTVLAATLVELASADPTVNQPIYLSLGIETNSNATVNASTDSVSIVRWVAGEPWIWIRVGTSSDTWVNNEGVIGPPTRYEELSFEIGTQARLSDQFYDTSNGLANLPFNTRNPDAVEGEFHLATSTVHCLNFSQSTLMADGYDGSLLDADYRIFNYQVEIGLGVYSPEAGEDITGITFIKNYRVARGKARNPNIIPIPGNYGLGSSEGDGFIAFNNQLKFRVEDNRANTVISTNVENGSVLRLQADGPSNFGFENGDVFFSTPGISPGEAVYSSPVTVAGRTLYRTVDLFWSNGETSLASPLDLTIDVTAHYAENNPATSMAVSWQMFLASHDGAVDSAPYDGPDQHKRCEPTLLAPINETTWIINGCQIEAVSLEGHRFTVTGPCTTGVDVYARDVDGNFILVASGIEVSGSYSLDLAEVLPGHYYGVVPAGAVPSDVNYIHTAYVSVPTLGTWALLITIAALLSAGLYMMRAQRRKVLI